MLIKLLVIALPICLCFDLLWLGVIAKHFYSKQIGHLMKTDINWTAAIIFYVIFMIGLIQFVIIPAIDKESWRYALQMGALFGLVSYATYDLTNLAVIKNWPVAVTILDMAWGTILAAIVSLGTYVIANKLGL